MREFALQDGMFCWFKTDCPKNVAILRASDVAKQHGVHETTVRRDQTTVAEINFRMAIGMLKAELAYAEKVPPIGGIHGRAFDSAKTTTSVPITLPVIGPLTNAEPNYGASVFLPLLIVMPCDSY